MTGLDQLPPATRPLLSFAGLLHQHGFQVSPEQTVSFLQSVGLLGPSGMTVIHRAARAVFAPPPERHPEFDALFRFVFFGQSLDLPGAPGEEPEMLVGDDPAADIAPEPEEISEAGTDATGAEVLAIREFTDGDEEAGLRHFRRAAPEALPRRRSHRRTAHRRGQGLDMRRTLQRAVRHDGEVLSLVRQRRKPVHRRILLLVDISGSMKAQTRDCLRFAHGLVQAARQIEVFTIGTRLTRISRPLARRNREHALAQAGTVVADWDGGTRLGEAIGAFLAIPRFAGFARGALVIVVSDGLERGDHAPMTASVRTLSQLSWRLVWLTPLSTGDGWEPETRALRSVMPFVDLLGRAGGIDTLCRQILSLGGALR